MVSGPKAKGAIVAAARAAQVASHISGEEVPQLNEQTESKKAENTTSTPSKPRRRRRKSSSSATANDDLPADYSDILSQLSTLRKLSNTPDHNRRGYVKQKESGKLWVRERIDLLLDKGSLREFGSAAGHATWKPVEGRDDATATAEGRPSREEIVAFTPFNNPNGFGRVNGREIVFTADDFSIRAGHQDGHCAPKTLMAEELALKLRMPIVKLVDGSSGGGSVPTIQQWGFSYVPPMSGFETIVEQLNSGIPNLGAVLGPAIGLGAARVVSCHFSVMAADVGSLFNAGPKVVAGATFEEGLSFTDLGGPGMHCTNGTIDNAAENEEDALNQIRTVLSFLPDSGLLIPPTQETSDDPRRQSPELRSIIPRRRERMYDSRRLIRTIVDQDSWFEIGALWGTAAIVGLARLQGRPIGIIANNAEVATGTLDAAGAQKIARHLKFCDVFNLPVLQFVDVPGYAVGTVAERTATMRWGVELAKAYYATTTSIFSVLVRKVYGVAGGIMVDARHPRMRVAWPSGEWGSLPLEGGLEVGHAAELRKIEMEKGKEARAYRLKELATMYRRLMNPVRTANHFGVEEIVDPARTREVVCDWARMVYERELPERVARRMNGQLQPRFS